MRREKGYTGKNYRALMLAEEKRRRQDLKDKYYGYTAIAILAFITGVWLGVALTNGTW